MRRLSTLVLLALLVTLSLSGCATTLGKSLDEERELFLIWEEENKRQNQALGERVFDKDFDVVFTAIITGLADLGSSIRNMERQSGYILAEGPLPLPHDEEANYGQAMSNELNRISPNTWHAMPGNAKHAATITVLRIANKQTKVKIRISTTEVRGNYSTIIHSVIYPPMLEAEYKAVWRAIERQVFLDENLDGTGVR